jgi:hypothetical protein
MPTGMALWLLLSGLVSPHTLLAQADAQGVRCDYSYRIGCDENGCEADFSDIGFVTLPSAQSLLRTDSEDPWSWSLQTDSAVVRHRCDQEGCADISVRVSRSGIFLNFVAPGYLLKVSFLTQDRVENPSPEFVEVDTYFLNTYVRYGRCQPLRG